jgi:isochorismate pyruvate lyase
MKPPEACDSLADVREAIDTLDRELLALLGRRAAYVHAAARFKTDAASVRAPERVRAMLERRRAWAAAEGLDPEVVAQLFTLLVEYFTRREQRVVEARASGEAGGAPGAEAL